MNNRVVRRSVREDDSVIYCPQCGHANPETARYCMKCGAHLVVGSQQAPARTGPPKRLAALYDAPAPYVEKRQNNNAGLLALLGVVIFAVAVLLGLLFLPGTLSSSTVIAPPSAPPSYVKDLSVLKEGTKAFNIYFTLADASGALTTADGTAKITIYDDEAAGLWQETLDVNAGGFQEATLGIGALAHDALIFPVGRVAYTAFTLQPSTLTGKAHLTFRMASGVSLEGDTTLIFER